jgi:hypothetical protein
MSRPARRRLWVVVLCLAIALALPVASVDAATAFRGHAVDTSSSMPRGCDGCDRSKAMGDCAIAACGTVLGVLADGPQLECDPGASPVAATIVGRTSLATRPDPLPPRR